MSTPATARPAAAAVSLTRDEATSRGWFKAADRVLRAEHEALAAFAELHAQTARAAEQGYTLGVDLTPGMAAFYSWWKQGVARQQGREIAQHDHDEWAGGA
jgi:hypothetical protein